MSCSLPPNKRVGDRRLRCGAPSSRLLRRGTTRTLGRNLVPSTLIRRRATQALVVVVVLAFGPVVTRELWPSAGTYVPPAMLLLSTMATVFLALAAWRTEWVVAALFPVSEVPHRMQKIGNDLHRIRTAAAVAGVVDGVLIALWVKSLL